MSKQCVIVESSGKSVEAKSVPGLFSCVLKHEVKSTAAEFIWTGPKLKPEQWNQILAYFRWTYETEKSEAQVRLFVHPEHGWLAWAFPQEGGTGMTSKEVENEDSKKQRAEKIPEGYIAFGTVHHHCAAGAFQSRTDTMDEKGQDGLHITVGSLSSPQYDLHCRFYLKGHKFDPQMENFYEVPAEDIARLETWKGVKGMTINVNEYTKGVMCDPPDKEQAVPEEWKANYLVKKVATWNGFNDGKKWCYHCQERVDHDESSCPHKDKPFGRNHYDEKYGKTSKPAITTVQEAGEGEATDKELLEAYDDVLSQCYLQGMEDADVLSVLKFLNSGEPNAFAALALLETFDKEDLFRIQGALRVREITEATNESKQIQMAEGGIYDGMSYGMD